MESTEFALSFFVGGKKKTFKGDDAAIIEAASMAALRTGNDQTALAQYQELFGLGTTPRKRDALAYLLIGLDNGECHTERGSKGLFENRPLAGMYESWGEILARQEPLHYVRVCVNATTAIIHNGGPQVRISGNPQAIVADSGDDDRDKNDWEQPVIPAARIGFATATEVVRELTQRDIDGIIEDLEAWGEH